MMGGHEKNVLISWLVHDISTGIQDELLTKGPSHKGTRVLVTKDCSGVTGVRAGEEYTVKCHQYIFRLYMVCTLDGML